jgi:hypothetical protein
MASSDTLGVVDELAAGNTLAVADRVLVHAKPGELTGRVEALIGAITGSGVAEDAICKALLRLGMNFAGRDAEIVGYGADEAQASLELVLAAIDGRDTAAAGKVVADMIADMKSVNLADSLSGLLAERIEPDLDGDKPGSSFLALLKQHMRSGVYWKMIGDNQGKFGNDFARGLEYLRHFGFCQVSTNPVLAAKAFDEDPQLTEELKVEVAKHKDWLEDPEAHKDAIAMGATLIALWPNLSIFRPLAIHAGLKDYMVSFQLNPNIAHEADTSIEDARNAYKVAADFLKGYDQSLGLGDQAGSVEPCIVFKVAANFDAARKITTVLNSEGIGTNNTVVYTVAQEVQLILDAFEGKAAAVKAGKQVVRTYETNMGGRFVSHLREVEAEKIFLAVAEKAGEARAVELLGALADDLGIDESAREAVASASVAEKAEAFCSYAKLKSLDHPVVLQAAEAAGQSQDTVRLLEEDLKKGGTLVARRVYWVYYSPENRPKWIAYLQKAYGVTEDQARWILESMDVLPASKRIPEDTYHTLAAVNMCNTEFPNHSRAVQIASEQPGFDLSEFREAVLDSYDPGVAERLRDLPDYCKGYDLTPSLKKFLQDEVGVEVSTWQTKGIEPAQWPDFGSCQKTGAEFRSAYDTFAAKCVAIATEVAGG